MERTQPDQPTEAPSTPATLDIILSGAADRLDAINPDTAMSSNTRFLQIQLAVWDHHGVYNGAEVGRDITAALAAVRDLPLTGTRGEYAARLRLTLKSVTH